MTIRITLPQLKTRLPTAISRFAPSPTGHLHLGHVVSALYVWGLAAALAPAKIWLRLEDHDQSRCRREFADSIVADLAWLGLTPTNLDFQTPGLRPPSDFRQSDCQQHYTAALNRLSEMGRIYACDCSRKRIALQSINASHQVDDEETQLIYDGHCRQRRLPLQPGYGLRLRLDDCDEEFDDLLLGPQKQNPLKQGGDFLIRDRQGQWTYHFAVVVDDLRHGVNLIIRGQDLMTSTGRQLQLARLLGQSAPPLYAHHPLLLDANGHKLSKRFFATSIASRRAAGEAAVSVWGEVAWRLQLIDAPRALSFSEATSQLHRFLWP